MDSALSKRLGAEALGTFWLVLGGVGTAVFVAGGDDKWIGVSLAFGLTVVTGAYAFGPISGGHFNPAVTLGQVVAKRFPANEALSYIVAQVVGGIVAAAVIYGIAKGNPGFVTEGNFLAANGYGDWSPGGYNLAAGILTEIVMTFMFLMVILGVTAKRANGGMAGLAIGLCLALIHFISVPVTNTSVNPARSIGPALFVGGDLLTQVWVFILAPILGAVLAGGVYAAVFADGDTDPA